MSMFINMRTGADAGAIEAAADAQTTAASANQQAAELKEQVEKLTLVCAAMWELLRERTGLTEQDLAERVAIIDARDGVADGKMTSNVRPCCKCARPVAAKHRKCLYCGAEQPVAGIFEGL